MAGTSDALHRPVLAEAVAALIAPVAPAEVPLRVRQLACNFGNASAPTGLFVATSFISQSTPPAGRLTEQQLVDLLKMPTCVQSARQVIVRQLGWQCGQTFADKWDFVDWARQHRPDLGPHLAARAAGQPVTGRTLACRCTPRRGWR
ncbi:MAG TPA: hypothetical protein VMS17_14075 [Gemmataceae bacterium]|nr:hypothetical protein [Gemmataceae bacterium]